MATVSGIDVVVLDLEALKKEIQPWLDLNPYPAEANYFYTTQLVPLFDTWNMAEALAAWFPSLSTSGTNQIQELMDTMNNWKAGYSLHDSHDVAMGYSTTVGGEVVPV